MVGNKKVFNINGTFRSERGRGRGQHASKGFGKVYLLALERLCGSLTMLQEKFRSVVEVRIEKIRLSQNKQNELRMYYTDVFKYHGQ